MNQATPHDDSDKATALRIGAKAFVHGRGQPRNPEKAIELYCEAAHLGDAEAQYNLGWMYAMGRGIERDDSAAAYFFTLAAQQGDPLATRMLKQVGAAPDKPPKCVADILGRFDADGHDIVARAMPEHRKVMDLVQKLAPEYGVYPRLAMAIIRAESNFNPTAVSPKNAQCLMQLIPETAERFNVKKPFDPEQNIRGGLAYLRWLLAYFQGNIALEPPDAKLPQQFRPVWVRIGRPVHPGKDPERMGDHRLLRQITDEVMFEIGALSGQTYVDEYANKKPEETDIPRQRRGVITADGPQANGHAVVAEVAKAG